MHSTLLNGLANEIVDRHIPQCAQHRLADRFVLQIPQVAEGTIHSLNRSQRIHDHYAIDHAGQDGIEVKLPFFELLLEQCLLVAQMLQLPRELEKFRRASEYKTRRTMLRGDLLDDRFHVPQMSKESLPPEQECPDEQHQQSDEKPDQTPLLPCDAVAEAPHRLDAVRCRTKLLAQAAHVRVHCAGVDHAFVAPDVVEQRVAALHTPTPFDEQREELELGRRELDLLVLYPDLMPFEIHADCAELEQRAAALGCAAGIAAQNGFYPQHQLARAEWLRDVIIRAQFESDDPVHLLRLCGEHDDWDRSRRGVALQCTAYFQPTHSRQHQVEHDQRRHLRARLTERFRAAFRLEHCKARAFEIDAYEVEHIFLIVRHEHFVVHRVASQVTEFARAWQATLRSGFVTSVFVPCVHFAVTRAPSSTVRGGRGSG